MIRNNTIAFAIHFLIIVIFTLLAWADNETILLYASFSTILVYFFTGFLLLKPNVKYAFLSVSSVLVLILFVLILGFINGALLMLCFNINPTNWWVINVLFSLFGVSNSMSDVMYAILTILPASFIPSLLMYFGILAKRKQLKHKRTKADQA